ERFAHGHDARAQLGGQLPDPQPLSAAVIAVENARLHRFENLIADARADFRLGLAHVRQSILAEAIVPGLFTSLRVHGQGPPGRQARPSPAPVTDRARRRTSTSTPP